VRDIDTAVVGSLKVLDPNRPIREAEVAIRFRDDLNDIEKLLIMIPV
jgi:hypothetical protein